MIMVVVKERAREKVKEIKVWHNIGEKRVIFMGEISINIGDLTVGFIYESLNELEVLNKTFSPRYACNRPEMMTVSITTNYGVPFQDCNVAFRKEGNKVYFKRADYLIESTLDYTSATIHVHDELALKHALMNLYSSYIVYHNWGLLIHSSCAIQNDKAHIFAGHSGAGKSTAARLSQPRELLSDEATIVKITEIEITVFDSPFRSELQSTGYQQPCPLAGIQILHQAEKNSLEKMRKPDALLSLMDKVFYWSHDPAETQRIMGLLRILVEKVPVYELYFRKDPTFWELIS
ncbi:hypothetical protein [Mesobacillus subterraneus]|uniref:hypothetical protein n=1 Tax=Mesobacillus subterraneus TaxID=285983 RepID=UPI001CFCA74A|nr:hypothetical protein [Mesobacillus subterraneus]